MQTPFPPLRNLPILAIAYLLNACSADATGPVTPPPPGFEPRFDVTVTMRYLLVSSEYACDGLALITNAPRDGEFQYRILVESGDKFFGSMESRDYGSVFGEAFSRLPGELINFANRDFTIESLKPGDIVGVGFFGTEWDGTEKDSRMNNQFSHDFFRITNDFKVGTFRDKRVASGSGDECELTLVWDLSVSKRLVPVL